MPNSGDALELQVPSYIRKDNSGWTNYSGKVISLEVSEKNVGYRGSKSVTDLKVPTCHKSVIVKEQRVDGIGRKSNFLRLRYTLKSYESNLVIKVLPNLIIKRNYTADSVSLSTDINSITNKSNPSIDPWFITGFTDAEASFMVVFQKSSKAKNGYFVTTRFKISLHVRDEIILEQFQAYFGAGSLQSSGKSRNSIDYIVKSRKELIERVLPHFDKYPLITQKRTDYELFKRILLLMDKKEHLSKSGFEEIISIRSSMNLGLADNLQAEFPNVIPCHRPLVENSVIPHPQWIAGFTTGEGSFIVLVRAEQTNNKENKYRIVLRCTISQHKRDKQLMVKLIDYLNCGRLLNQDDNMTNFWVESSKDVSEKIIPFFLEYRILGFKGKVLENWIKIANIIKTKGLLLNKNDAEEIIQIRDSIYKESE